MDQLGSTTGETRTSDNSSLLATSGREPFWRRRLFMRWVSIAVVVTLVIIVVVVVLVTLPSPSSGAIVRFLQLSDMHYDSINRTCECNYTYTCLTLPPCGYYGCMGCDSSPNLINSVVQTTQSYNPTFVIVTGDFAAHRPPAIEIVREEQKFTWEQLSNAFPTTPVIPAIGNDDAYPNYCVGPNQFDYLWNLWQPGILCAGCYSFDPSNEQTFRLGGYYAVDPVEGLRVLVLDTVFYTPNYFKYCNATMEVDPFGQFGWLVAQLSKAAVTGSKVIIAAHVAPGADVFYTGSPDFFGSMTLWEPTYIEKYLEILSSTKATIVGQIFGHTHRDSFRMQYDDGNSQRTVGVANLAPSVTPIYNNNPAFRLWYYSSTSFSFYDYAQYFLDLDRANRYYPASPTWQLEYDFVDTYEPGGSFSTESLQALSLSLSSDPLLFQQFYDRWATQFTVDRYVMTCTLRNTDRTAFERCLAAFGHP